MSGKITRRVTVDSDRRLSADGSGLNTAFDQSQKMKKRSVFERLGTAGAAYEAPDKCRTFMREGECPYGKKCKYSHDIGHQDLKRSGKGEKVYIDASYDDYQGLERSPERKKDKRKFVDAEKFKIEFKKDVALKNKQSIAELYEEEIPMRKSKKEKREASAAHSKSKKSYDDDVMIEKEGSVRNVQLKGDDKRERKIKYAEISHDEELSTHSKKQKKKKYHEESEEETNYKDKAESAARKKRKKKARYSSSSSESSTDEKMKKKKAKKEKYKAYESDDSSGGAKQKKRIKSSEYEKQLELQMLLEAKKRKKKAKKERYESDDVDDSDKEVYLKSERVYEKPERFYEKAERAYEDEKPRKSSKYIEEDVYSERAGYYEQEPMKKKKSKTEKLKDEQRRSESWSIPSESSSLESDGEKTKGKKSKSFKEDKYIAREKKSDRYVDDRVSHRKSYEGKKDVYVSEERKRDHKSDRDHYAQPPAPTYYGNQESPYETWDRDSRPPYDDRPISSQHAVSGGSSLYGHERERDRSAYRSRYEAHGKSSEDRQPYRQYPEQQYPSDQGRYYPRGGRDSYGHSAYRKGAYPGEDEGYPASRSRDYYQGSSTYPQGNTPDDKVGYKHRGEYPPTKEADDVERERKRSSRRPSVERKGYDSSPRARRRTKSPVELQEETDARNKKRKRDPQSIEKEQSVERKAKKTKVEGKPESEAESGSEADGGRKGLDRDKKYSGRSHRDSGGHYRRDDLPEDRRDRRPEKSGRDRERDRERDRDRERGREREREHRHKRGSSNDRSRRDRHTSRSDKRGDSPSYDERGNRIEDKRVRSLKTAHGRNSPSDRSDHDSGSRSHRRRDGSKGRGTPADDKDLNLDEVYEKISDDELDFFDEENSKSKKPAPLDELDWSALAAIKPVSKRADEGSEHSHIAKHSAVNILRKIGFSTNLLSEATLEKIKQKSAEQDEKSQKENKTVDFAELSGTGAVVLNKIRYQERRRDLICGLAKEGNVLSMRKDINIRKELRIPSQRLGMNGSLFCQAPSSPADRDIFLASASLYKKIPPGETQSPYKIMPSLVGSVIQCCT